MAQRPPAGSVARRQGYGPAESVVRRPFLAAVPLLVLVSIAAAMGLTRAPTYTAEARLLVGSIIRDFTPAAGLVDANQELTDIYSRVVGSPAHLDLTGDELGTAVPPEAVDASPVPDSPFIRVEATGGSPEQAVERADAAAVALERYVAGLRAEAVTEDEGLLSDFADANRTLAQARLDRDAAQKAYDDLPTTAAARDAAAASLVDAEAAFNSAQLQADALRSRLNSSEAAPGGGIGLDVFSAAEPGGSDRMSSLAVYVIAALLVGGLIGAALATLAVNNWRLVPRPTDDPPATDSYDVVPPSG